MIEGLEANFNGLYLRRTDHRPFYRLPGFTRGKHTVPDRASASAAAWARALLETELRDEMKIVYGRAKSELKLRHGQVKKILVEGGGSVVAKDFSFSINADQDEDPALARIVRQVHVFVPLESLSANFDAVFPKTLDEIVLPLLSLPDFDTLVPVFEAIADTRGGKVSDDEEAGEVEYTAPDGTRLFVDLTARELVMRTKVAKSCLSLLRDARETLGS